MLQQIETSVGEMHDILTAPAISEYGNLVTILEDSATRMAQKTRRRTFDSLLYKVIGVRTEDFNYYQNVFVTDHAPELPYPSTIFHVTGGRALERLQNGGKLIPTDEHFLGDVVTDKGILVHIVPAFMETLGVKLSNLQQFLFSGPQIDAEQVAHHNKNVGKEINAIGLEIFLQQRNGDYVLTDELRSILIALDEGIQPIFDEKLKIMVDSFVEKMYSIPNIREGWLNHIRNILYGLEPFYKEGFNSSIVQRVEERLLMVEYMYRKLGKTNIEPAVVLEIDTRKLIDLTTVDGLYTVLIGTRPIESIFPSLVIPPNAVQTAYVAPENLPFMPKGAIPIQSLDDVDESRWLGGVHWRKVNPDMDNPLCAIRYTQGKETTWWDIASSGLIAPAKTIAQIANSTPPMVLTNVFGREHFSFMQSALYKSFPKLFEYAIEEKFGYIDGVFDRLEGWTTPCESTPSDV